MIESWLLAIIPALLILFLALFIRAASGSWLMPGAIFSLFWAIMVFLPLLIAPDYEVAAGSVWSILAACFAVYAGTLVAGSGLLVGRSMTTGKDSRDSFSGEAVGFHLFGLREVVFFFIVLGLFGSVISIWQAGGGLASFLSIKGIARMGHEFSVLRYSGQYSPSLIAQFFRAFVYCAPLFGGLLFLVPPRTNRWIALMSLLPAVTMGVAHTTRSTIVFAGIFWMASYFSGQVVINKGPVRLFTKARVIASVFLSGFLVTITVILQIFRGGGYLISYNLLLRTFLRLRVLFCGHLAAYSSWFQGSGYGFNIPRAGAFSFAGLFNLLGLHDREIGLYIEAFQVSTGHFTNVYTLFRGLIEDFTVMGALVVLFIIGIIAGRSYSRLQEGQLLYLPLLAGFYALTLWSSVTSVFNYNSVIAAWFLFTGYFFVQVIVKKAVRQERIPKQYKTSNT